jgi:antibiotic biosynthesis monooxygenase (ABM) superfamily enzyme
LYTERDTIIDLKTEDELPASTKKKKSFWRSKRALPIYTVSLLILTTYFFIPQARSLIDPLWILIRVFLIIMIWYLLIAPILLKVFQAFLKKKSSQYKEEVDKAISLIPNFKKLVFVVWKKNSELKNFRKLSSVLTQVIAFALIYNNEKDL